jgi:hypothetical protein
MDDAGGWSHISRSLVPGLCSAIVAYWRGLAVNGPRTFLV